MKQSGIKVNDKIYFKSEKKPYRVKAFDGRYAICTKPFNLQKTVIYTIIDFKENKRSSDSYGKYGKYKYSLQEDIDEALKALKSGEMTLSVKNAIDLDILKVESIRM